MVFILFNVFIQGITFNIETLASDTLVWGTVCRTFFQTSFLISDSSIEEASPGNILTRALLVGYSVVTSTGAASFELDIHPVS